MNKWEDRILGEITYMCLTLSTLGKVFSKRHFLIFFLYIYMSNPVYWENREKRLASHSSLT